MRDEILRRALVSVPQLLLMSFITFLFIELAPGDVLAKYRFDPRVNAQILKEIESKYHFDKPVLVQYGHWLWRMLHFDLGYSFSREANVTSVIAERLFNTLLLSFVSFSLPG